MLAGHAGIAIDHAQTYAEARQQAAGGAPRGAGPGLARRHRRPILRERDVRTRHGARSPARPASWSRHGSSASGWPTSCTQTIRFPVAVGDGSRGAARPRGPARGRHLRARCCRAGEAMRLDQRTTSDWRAAGLRPIVPSRSQLIVPVVAGDETLAVILAVDSQRDRRARSTRTTRSCSRRSPRSARSLSRPHAPSSATAAQRGLGPAPPRRGARPSCGGRRSRRVVEAQERERRRIAQDLHDHTAGALASIRLSVKRIERDATPSSPSGCTRRARDIAMAIEELRDLIADLRPKVLDDYGLEPAVERLARRRRAPHRASRCPSPPSGALADVPAELATATYRIVQEALVNVARHAGAPGVEITAGRRRRHGCWSRSPTTASGSPGARSDGLGLAGMKERASLVGGRVDIEPRVRRRYPRPLRGAPVTRVLIVDDHAIVRSGVRRLLEEVDGFEVVGEAGRRRRGPAPGALRAAGRRRPGHRPP